MLYAEKNVVFITGKVDESFVLDHKAGKHEFYRIMVNVKRQSETSDIIPVIVPPLVADISEDIKGRFVKIDGKICSYRYTENGTHHIRIFVLASKLTMTDVPEYKNDIYVEGTLIHSPTIRKTPTGKRISDVNLIVERDGRKEKTDFIHCIGWGKIADKLASYEKGDTLSLTGRLQSRDIIEKGVVVKTVYEVAVNMIQPPTN